MAWLTVACVVLSMLSIPAAAITIKQEEELADEFLQVLKRHFKLVEDPVVVDYVEGVGKRILEHMPPQPFTYHFYVVEQDVFNAFATPAGHIFVFTGLIESMEREEELAGILAHEIAHVQCRHISEKIERSKKVNMLSIAGTIAGILLGVGGMGEVGQAVAVGSAAASQSTMLAYSRQDETQADQIGIDNLIKAGYNGDGLVNALETIRSKQWFGSNEIPTYLMTHPAVEDRIVGIRNQVDTYHQSHGRPGDVDVTAFVRAKSRLAADPAVAANHLRASAADLKSRPQDPMAHYRHGLLLDKAGRRPEALSHLKSALSRRAFDPVILSDVGRIYFLEGKYDDAVSTLGSAVEMAPGEAEGRYYLGRALLEKGDFSGAAGHLERVVRDHAGYSEALFYLGKSYDRMGRQADALYCLGKFYHRNGEDRKAVFQLEKALDAGPGDDRKDAIQALLEEIREADKRRARESEDQQEDTRHRPGLRPFAG
ncbi:MAG: M48 family metalloprotease [Desulfobacterales bacterium]